MEKPEYNLFVERAAIIQYEGKESRIDAEIYAAIEYPDENAAWLDARPDVRRGAEGDAK